MKTVVVLIEDRAFALFFHPHHGAFGSLCSVSRNLPYKEKKRVKPGGLLAWGFDMGAAGFH